MSRAHEEHGEKEDTPPSPCSSMRIDATSFSHEVRDNRTPRQAICKNNGGFHQQGD